MKAMLKGGGFTVICLSPNGERIKEKSVVIQGMLNAIEPGSPLPIHRYKHTSETVVCLRGRLVEEFYNEFERTCTESIEMASNGPIALVNVSAGQWHTVRAIESVTVLMECKDGPWEPLGKEDILKV